MDRRKFLERTAAAGLAACWPPAWGTPAGPETGAGREPQAPLGGRKLLIVQFGGGARFSETVGDPEHRHIPRLWKELAPRGALFTNMRVQGKVVHPNSTGSMLTGHWEWDHLDWTKPVAHPTIFEVYRRAARASDHKAWAFFYAAILAKAGESAAAGFGAAFAANVVLPPTIPRSSAEEMDRLMRASAVDGSAEAGAKAAAACADLARKSGRISLDGLRSQEAREFVERQFAAWQCGGGSTSHDAFLASSAMECMKTFAPDVLTVCFGEIDCAHYGSWSRYVEAIERTDALTWRLWQTVRALDAYRDRTLMLVLPDHGRELEESGGLGFVHHSDFYTGTGVDEGCRRVWMLAIGPGVPARQNIGDAIPITTVAGTGLEFLGLRAPAGAAESVWHRLEDFARRPR